MIVYWALFSLPVLWRFMAGLYPQLTRSGVILIIPILVILIGLRDKVGCDWFNYIKNFDDISRYSLLESMQIYEPGHVLVNAAANAFDFTVHATNVIYAILFTIGFIAFVQRQPIPWLTLLSGISYLIIVVSMGYTRQAAAIGLLCFAFNACADRRVVATVGWVILAGFFHKSALLFIGLIPAAREFRLDFINLSALPFALAGLVFMSRDVDQYVQGYVQSGMVSEGGPARLALTALAGTLFFIFRKMFRRYRDYYIFFLFACLSILSLPGSAIASTAADRLALYLLPFQIAVMARLPLAFEGPQMQNLVIAGIIVVYAGQQYIWLNYAANAYCWVPYKNLILPNAF